MDVFKRAIGPAITLVGGMVAVLNGVIALRTGQQLFGLEPWAWGAIGGGAFTVGTVSTLMSFQSKLDRLEKADYSDKTERLAPATAASAELKGSAEPAALVTSDSDPASSSQEPDPELVDRLFAEAEWAVHNLLNVDASRGNALSILKDIEREWRNDTVIPLMRKAGCASADISDFRVLGTYEFVGLPGLNPEHVLYREEVNARIQRLKEAARRLEQGEA